MGLQTIFRAFGLGKDEKNNKPAGGVHRSRKAQQVTSSNRVDSSIGLPPKLAPARDLRNADEDNSVLTQFVASNEKAKKKEDAIFEGMMPKGSTSIAFGIVGNDLSIFAVMNYGDSRVGFFVHERHIGTKKFVSIQDKIKEKSNLLFVRIADPTLIAELNGAVNEKIDENVSSDVGTICRQIVGDAIDAGATDIHICCRKDFSTAMVLNRIHGRIHQYRKLEPNTADQVAGHLFYDSEPTSRRPVNFTITQNEASCVIKHVHKREPYKLRYQFAQTSDGWDLIIRILPIGEGKKRTFKELGYSESQIRLIELSVRQSIGLVGILGPTGSGKSTTLKTMMEFDENRRFKKRYSLEDPPEYKIFGVSQIPVQDGDFATALKRLLRSDPDDVMVGETRDPETASVLADAILTGHKLYTTLHTGSAIGAYTRLSRLNLDRNIMADRQFVAVMIFQRLMPVLCQHCRIKINKVDNFGEYKLNLLHRKFRLNLDEVYCAKEEGCEHCRAGIAGSTVVAEVVVPDAGLRRFIADGDDDGAERYWRQSRTSAFTDPDMTGKTAFEHAIYKVSRGIIDPRDVESEFQPFETYEVVRVAADE